MKSFSLIVLAVVATGAVEGSAPAPVCASNSEDGGKCSTNDDSQPSSQPCGLYLTRSSALSEWSVFAGTPYAPQEPVGPTTDLLLPIVDANKNEYSPWHDIVWPEDLVTPERQQAPHQHRLDHFWAGIGALASCSQRPTVAETTSPEENEVVVRAAKSLRAGEEITVDCGDSSLETTPLRGTIQPVEWLQENGVCLDTLTIQESTVAGRGAFAQRAFTAGDVVAVSPVLHFDRSQTEILRQERISEEEAAGLLLRDHRILYSSQVVGQQRILNYCYSHPQSNVMLLPMAPAVNFINHASRRSSQEPNVAIRWSTFSDSQELREDVPVMELFEQPAGDLVVEFVALRDIPAGQEVLIDYGEAWEHAWDERQDDDSFRHEMGVPEDFYPSNWIKFDSASHVHDFIANPLKPGHMAPLRWANTGQVVTPWAFRMGLDSKVRHVLLDYCNKMGITEMLQHVTLEGNGLEPGTDTHLELEGDDWFLQRPEAKWRSNLHWLSPGAAAAHEHYLQALSVAGFDEILQSIGEYLGMDGLVAFHVTFIAVSHSTKGYLHHDMDDTGRSMYNVIIPLILANETNPELDIQDLHPDLEDDDQDFRVGRYQYEYDVAGMMGDGAVHGTSAVDYRMNKEMRMAATVYITDVNEDNVDSISTQYTQAYPPSDRNLLLSWAGRHWKKDDPTAKLPEPEPDHILRRRDTTSSATKA